jgi:uncharacterized protein (DUF4415 family)
MKEEYDFSDGVPNPYGKIMRQQITIRIDKDILQYFKDLADKTGLYYQNLINSCLYDYMKNNKEPKTEWLPADSPDVE